MDQQTALLEIEDIIPTERSSSLPRASRLLFSWGMFLLLVLALLLWFFSLRSVDLSQMSDLGLVSVLPFTFFFALFLLLSGYIGLLSGPRLDERLLLLYNLVLILMVHGTPNLLYGTLRYSWAWKHVGIIDYILRHGSVNPQISVLDIYHNWPGFFALGALFTRTGGFDSALAFAGWGPLFFNLLYLVTLSWIFNSFSANRRLNWLAVWLFFLTSWVGQDYFSPQALGYFFYLIILGICLHYFQPTQPGGILPRLEKAKRLLPFFEQYYRFDQPSRALATMPSPAQRLGLGAILLLVFAAIVSSHQLTPFIAIIAVLILVIFGYCNWKYLPLIMALMTLAWLAIPAATYFFPNLRDILESFGQLGSNIGSNLVNLAGISQGQYIVSLAGRGLSALILGLGFLGLLRRLAHKVLDLPAILLFCAPLPLLLVSSYGGEILFRIYFFALPFVSFLAAGLAFPTEETRLSGHISAGIAGVSLLLVTGLALAYYGKDQQYYFSPQEVQAAEAVYKTAPPNTLLVEGSRDYPGQFLNYENFVYVPLDREPEDSLSRVLAQPVETLGNWMSDPRYAAAYLILTRSQKAYVDSLGIMPRGALDRIEQALRQSPKFTIIYNSPDAVVFKYAR